MFVVKPAGGVVAAGTPNTHDVAASLDGNGARHLIISNTHATGVLYVQFSEDGVTYTAVLDVNKTQTIVMDGVNVAKLKVDASVSGTTYSIAGWRD